MQPGKSIVAGFLYFLIAFGSGFVLGAIRVLAVLPRVGEIAAVLIELPFMIAISAAAAAWLCRRFAVRRPLDGLAMGAIAFGLLQLAEAVLAIAIFRVPLASYLESLSSFAGMIGLAGQAIFALLPVLFSRPMA